MSLAINWRDVDGLERFDEALRKLGRNDAPLIYRRALSRTGDMAKTKVVRALTKQTGLPRKVIVKSIKVTRPSYSDLSYTMRTTGGDIALKFFKARETRKGVSAAPWGKRQVFPGTFMKGGRFPNRVPINMGGHVLERTSTFKYPLRKVKSGVIIPVEMLKGETADAFNRTVREVLPVRVAHEIKRATGGVIT